MWCNVFNCRAILQLATGEQTAHCVKHGLRKSRRRRWSAVHLRRPTSARRAEITGDRVIGPPRGRLAWVVCRVVSAVRHLVDNISRLLANVQYRSPSFHVHVNSIALEIHKAYATRNCYDSIYAWSLIAELCTPSWRVVRRVALCLYVTSWLRR